MELKPLELKTPGAKATTSSGAHQTPGPAVDRSEKIPRRTSAAPRQPKTGTLFVIKNMWYVSLFYLNIFVLIFKTYVKNNANTFEKNTCLLLLLEALGPLSGRLGLPLAALGPLLGALGALFAALGRSWPLLGPSWALLGRS